MPKDEKPEEESSAPAPKKEEVAPESEEGVTDEPVDTATALAEAKEVENQRAGEDDPMKDETDAVGDPIVGVTGDMYRPPYIHKGPKA